MEFLLAALSLGFLGSFHCVGMCGPIALALPLNKTSKFARVVGGLIYNSGRILTYSLLGIIFGLLGKSFVIAGYQQLLSIVLGVLILLIVFLPESAIKKFRVSSTLFSMVGQLKSKLASLFQQKNYTSLFFIGLLNGLLPCGLVYLGIIGAIATGEALKGAAFMAVFGLGTTPAMLGIALISNSISLNVRNRIRKAVPVFVVLMAAMLIVRGLNLGIPYLSPQFDKQDCSKHTCCHKK